MLIRICNKISVCLQRYVLIYVIFIFLIDKNSDLLINDKDRDVRYISLWIDSAQGIAHKVYLVIFVSINGCFCRAEIGDFHSRYRGRADKYCSSILVMSPDYRELHVPDDLLPIWIFPYCNLLDNWDPALFTPLSLTKSKASSPSSDKCHNGGFEAPITAKPHLGPVSLRLMTSQFKDIVTHTQN